MVHFLQSMAAPAIGRSHAAGETAVHAGLAFAMEKRRIDAQFALASTHGRMMIELVNSLRQSTTHIKL
jgi:hypothetical protein